MVFCLVGVFAVGHGENDFKLADAPGVRAHGFGDFDAGSGHVHIVHFAVNADDGPWLQLASAVAQRSVGEKPSPLPLLSTGASVMRRAPLAA